MVRDGKILLSPKSLEYLQEHFYEIDDLRNSILNGEVRKKERDEKKVARYKYTIIGLAKDGSKLYSCGKVVSNDYFVITFHKTR